MRGGEVSEWQLKYCSSQLREPALHSTEIKSENKGKQLRLTSEESVEDAAAKVSLRGSIYIPAG